MKVYIDESGIFSNPNNKPHAVSCIAGLIIPELEENEIFDRFRKISSNWANESGEIKGSRLDEHQVEATISLLKDYKVILEVCAIDSGIHRNGEIERHKRIQGGNLVKNITPEFHPTLVSQLRALKLKIEKMPNQLYTQFIILTELVNSILRSVMLYYCHVAPKTLGAFSWTIDAKDKQKTEYEELWSILAMGFLQTVFLNYPIKVLDTGDFGSMEKYMSQTSEIPRHLKKYAEDDVNRSSKFDIKRILTEDLDFIDSKMSTGLQIIDILVNAVRRAFNGNLQISGWGEIGNLMTKKFHGEHSIRMIMLKPETKIEIWTSVLPYFHVLKETDSRSRSALPAATATQSRNRNE